MESRVLTFRNGWYWKERSASHPSVLDEVPRLQQGTLQSASQWTMAQTFPSEIHVELMNTGQIPDPFIGFNEHKVQCNVFRISSHRK